MKKRVPLALILCTASAVALGGCAAADAPSGPVELLIWSTGDFQDELDLYNSTHPDVHVTMEIIPNTDYLTKLTTAVKAGNGPDIAGVQYQDLPTVLTTGILADISDYVSDDVEEKFVPWAWDQVERDGALYGIPADSGPLAMYYRTDLFEQYGLDIPTTWDDFRATAEQLKQVAPDAYLTAFSPGDTTWFMGLASQNGANWFETADDTWTVDIDGAASTEVADYWQGLLDDSLVTPAPYFSDGWNSGLQNGTILTWISAAWGGGFLASAAPDLSGKWGVAQMPSWDGEVRSANWGGSSVQVTTNSEHPQEAADFLVWLESDPENLALAISSHGIFPAALAGLEDPALKAPIEYLGGANLYDVFGPASTSIDTSVEWGPTLSQVITDVGAGFGLAVEGQSTLAEALSVAQEKTVSYMESQGFQVQAK